MKFISCAGARQYATIGVSCSVERMAEILKAVVDYRNPGNSHRSHIEDYVVTTDTNFLFASGAKLARNRNNFGPTFYIYCYHYSGEDGLLAMAQLEMGERILQQNKLRQMIEDDMKVIYDSLAEGRAEVTDKMRDRLK